LLLAVKSIAIAFKYHCFCIAKLWRCGVGYSSY